MISIFCLALWKWYSYRSQLSWFCLASWKRYRHIFIYWIGTCFPGVQHSCASQLLAGTVVELEFWTRRTRIRRVQISEFEFVASRFLNSTAVTASSWLALRSWWSVRGSFRFRSWWSVRGSFRFRIMMVCPRKVQVSFAQVFGVTPVLFV